MLFKAIIVMAMLAQAEPFKLSLKPPGIPSDQQQPQPQQQGQQQAQQQSLYPAQPIVQQQELHEPVGTKGEDLSSLGRNQQRPLYPTLPAGPQPQALAYVIVRPLQAHYPYYEPAPYVRPYSAPLFAPAAPLLPLRQEDQPQPNPLDQIPPKFQGKFSKLKSTIDKVLGKLTLGSSYQVISEETQGPDQQGQGQSQNQGQNQNQSQEQSQSQSQSQSQNQSQGQSQSQSQSQSQNQGENQGRDQTSDDGQDQNRYYNQYRNYQNYNDADSGFEARKRSFY